MTENARTLSRLDSKRRDQTPQALARLSVVGLFIGLWFVLALAHIPMPLPFLIVLAIEAVFLLAYWRAVFLIRSVRGVELAHYSMLAGEIVFHTTMVYFLGAASWLGAFAYVFGLIYANTFLDPRRGFIYTGGASAAFIALIVLEATGVVPHYVYLEQGALRYTDPRFVATTAIGAAGVFLSIYAWMNWVGSQLSRERDAAVQTQDQLLRARAELQQANEELETRVKERTEELESANAALRESEERLRTIASNAPVVHFAIDTDGMFTLSEGRGLEALGLKPGEVVGQSAYDLYHDIPEAQDNIRRALAGEAFTTMVEGQGLIFETHYAPVYGPGGLITGIIGVATDVTERAKAEAALRGREARNRALLEAIPDMIVRISKDGTILDYKPAQDAETFTPPDEMASKSIYELLTNEVGEGARRHIEQAFQTGATQLFEFSTLRNGETRDREARIIACGKDEALAIVRDISDRKQAEEALRESERLLRLVVTNAPIVLFAVDKDGEITLREGKALEAVGSKPGEGVGQSVFDFHGDAQPVLENVRRALAGETFTDTVEVRGVTLETHYAPVRDANDEVQAMIGVSADITERKLAEEALRASEAKYRQMFESVQDIFYRTDETGILTELSPSVERFGYTREELLGTSVLDIYDDPEERTQVVSTLLEHDEVTDYEISLKTGDGRVIAVSLNARLRRHADGTFAGSEGSIRDISERKRAEEALRQSESQFRTLAETMSAAVFILQGEKMRYVNPGAEELSGYTREELLTMNFWDAVHPEFTESAKERGLARQRGEDDHNDPEVKIITKSGEERWVEFRVGTIMVDGEPAILGTAFDVTERKRAEEEIRVLARFAEQNPDPVMRIIKDGTITHANKASLPLLKLWDCEVGQHLPDHWHLIISDVLASGESREVEIKLKNRVLALVFAPIAEAGYVNVYGRDITERRQAKEALERALATEQEHARRDPLTGVLNHAAIVDELYSLVHGDGKDATHAVAMVDVDGLKAINDAYGHQIGDVVLTTVANALWHEGVIVGRYGGDEFVAILPDSDRAAAERYRDKVTEELANDGLRDPETDTPIPVVASIGLAVYPEGGRTIAELIQLADSAMYTAKRQRPMTPIGRALPQYLGDARAAEMVGEILPFLTSPGELDDKLRLVAHRLSVGAGYDAVNFTLLTPEPGAPLAMSTFAQAPDELIEAWDKEQPSAEEGLHPVRVLLERTHRPIILDDPQNDERLREGQRSVLKAAGLQSAIAVPMLWQDELVGIMSVASVRKGAFGPRDLHFLEAIATQVSAIVRTSTLLNELQLTSARLAQAQDETVLLLAASAEAHDHTTGLHLQGVRALTESLAQEMGYSDEDARDLGLAAVLHDIGKIRVPDTVLASSGELAEEEWEIMKHHTTWGTQFLTGRPGFHLASVIARSHHERWDGSGYPDGLAGDDISEAATIAAVADSFDAITSDRPYRKRRSVPQALKEIVAHSGQQFNPKVVEALLRLQKRKALPLKSRRTSNQAA